MTDTWKTVLASEVQAGDHIRVPGSGMELDIARVEYPFMGRDAMLAFIEDSPARWFKHPCPVDTEVEVRVEPGAASTGLG